MRPASTLLDSFIAHQQHGRKALAVLLDPDDFTEASLHDLLARVAVDPVDYFFVGGSLVLSAHQAALLALLKAHSQVPVLLFPSHSLHLEGPADGLLLLSLISGRNPEFLIGQHVVAAPRLRASGLELLPTGYLLVDSGRPTTASYMSGTAPLPHDKPGIAATTALAGEQLGLRLTYLDAGSGALHPVSGAMIAAVRATVATPLIVGGGLNTAEKITAALTAGADVAVVGNRIAEEPTFLAAAVAAVRGAAVVA
ncbi:geranylgeranylglyceryl/heptaprenylglyceryl phosphate synthase [Hymenobacter sp. PAMC 26628]|uniref:geranylgeranylglyceryl/heptaprenylglyceryl phosphate synthase n=1 Tax=Hymenobacter sp. PAMC 26628 TaxID=1484118 RepID=UPI00076FE464|nr:geranylgeranylglyceryl/heptaprenylglyceryl phosphate synthase [Hymenobacter sp. PAMC 26628]AMJ67390.1 geranylgeranylglyceryl/heptaprenylglyceryl phosphate synthase [Hymenobacter sp. PAMC 26628]